MQTYSFDISKINLPVEFVNLREKINESNITWLTRDKKTMIINYSYPILLKKLENEIGDLAIINDINKKILNNEHQTIDEYNFIYNNYVNKNNIKLIVSYIYWKKNSLNKGNKYYVKINFLKKTFKIKGAIKEILYPLEYVYKCYRCGGKMLIKIYDNSFYKFKIECIDCNHEESYDKYDHECKYGFDYLDDFTFIKCNCSRCQKLKQDIVDFYKGQFEDFSNQMVKRISEQYIIQFSKENLISNEYLYEQYKKFNRYLTNEEIQVLSNLNKDKTDIKDIDLEKNTNLYNMLIAHKVIYVTKKFFKENEIKTIILKEFFNITYSQDNFYSSFFPDERYNYVYKKFVDTLNLNDKETFFSYIDYNGKFIFLEDEKTYAMDLLWRKNNDIGYLSKKRFIYIPVNTELHVNPYYIDGRENELSKYNKEKLEGNILTEKQKKLYKTDSQRLIHNILVKTLNKNIIYTNLSLKSIFTLDELGLLTEVVNNDIVFDFAIYNLQGTLLKLIKIYDKNELDYNITEKLTYKLKEIYKIELIVVIN